MKFLALFLLVNLATSIAFAQSIDCVTPNKTAFYGVESVAVVTSHMPQHREIGSAEIYINGELLKGMRLDSDIWQSVELLRVPANDSPSVFNEEIIVKLEKNLEKPVLRAHHTCNIYMNEERCGGDYISSEVELDCSK